MNEFLLSVLASLISSVIIYLISRLNKKVLMIDISTL